jgi:hypothetical protein
LNDPNGGNVANPSYSSLWGGPDLTAYAGGDVSGGDFDIANIVLVNPAPGASVTLPATFEWQRRSSTPSDRYEWELFNINTGDYWLSGEVGYVSGFVVSGLPQGVSHGTPYGWDVWVYDGLGGGGVSYYYRQVTFSGVALAGEPDTQRDFDSRRAERLEAIRVARANGSAGMRVSPNVKPR